MTSCAITGHRPTRFLFRYNEIDPLCLRLKKAIREELAYLYHTAGLRCVYVGGALGVDMWAGEAVVALQKDGYSDLSLVLVIPFQGHDDKWFPENRKRLSALRDHAQVEVLANAYSDRVYKDRNFYMVDHADMLLAVFDEEKSIVRSGTRQTVTYAMGKGMPLCFIHPDTAQVRRFGIERLIQQDREEQHL